MSRPVVTFAYLVSTTHIHAVEQLVLAAAIATQLALMVLPHTVEPQVEEQRTLSSHWFANSSSPVGVSCLIPNDKTISALAEELLKRELEKNADFGREKLFSLGMDASQGMIPLTPDQALLLGSLADAATTYTFLKRGKGTESNALIGFTKNHPEATAAASLGGTAASMGVKKLLERAGHKKLADMIGGGLGGYQFGVAMNNLDATSRSGFGGSTAITNEQLLDAIGSRSGLDPQQISQNTVQRMDAQALRNRPRPIRIPDVEK